MAPKGPKSAAKKADTATANKGGEKNAELPVNPAILVGGIVVLLAAFFYLISMPDGRVAQMITFFDENKISSKLNLEFDKQGNSHLTLKANTQQRDTVMTIPVEMIMDGRMLPQSPIGRLLWANNATVFAKYLEESNTSATSVPLYAATLVHERRLGSSSKWAKWFATIEHLPPMDGAVFWPMDYDDCFDPTTLMSIEGIRRSLNATSAAFVDLCTEDEYAELAKDAGCTGKPFSFEELKWGFAVYLNRNFQGQAIMPGLDLAAQGDVQSSLIPQYNQEANQIELQSMTGGRKGDEVFVSAQRGPLSNFVNAGRFDGNKFHLLEAVTISPAHSNLTDRICYRNAHELGYMTNTQRPTETLIRCVAAIVADNREKKKLSKNFDKEYRTNLALRTHAYGNVTDVLRHELYRLKSSTEQQTPEVKERCQSDAAPQFVKTYNLYREWALDLLEKTLKNQWEDEMKIRTKSGIARPMDQQQQAAAAAAQAQAQAGGAGGKADEASPDELPDFEEN